MEATEPTTPEYKVGPGILDLMTEHGDTPITDEVYFGDPPQWSEATAQSYRVYRYYPVTNEVVVYPGFEVEPPSTLVQDSPPEPAETPQEFCDRLRQGVLDLFGTPYVFGGKHIKSQGGLDCSGFVMEAFEREGVHIGSETADYTSAEDLRQATAPVDFWDVQPGDLIFFQSLPGDEYQTEGASHVGIWLRHGTMLDDHDNRGVGETNIYTDYWQARLLGFGRVSR